MKDTGTPGDHRTSVGKSCPDVTTGRRIALSTESVQEQIKSSISQLVRTVWLRG